MDTTHTYHTLMHTAEPCDRLSIFNYGYRPMQERCNNSYYALLLPSHGSGLSCQLNCDSVTLKQFKRHLKTFFLVIGPWC